MKLLSESGFVDLYRHRHRYRKGCTDGFDLHKLPTSRLSRIFGSRTVVSTRRAAAKANFNAGDAVSFIARGNRHAGVIVRMNPKRAKAKCGDAMGSVPYTRLDPRQPDGSEGMSSNRP